MARAATLASCHPSTRGSETRGDGLTARCVSQALNGDLASSSSVLRYFVGNGHVAAAAGLFGRQPSMWILRSDDELNSKNEKALPLTGRAYRIRTALAPIGFGPACPT